MPRTVFSARVPNHVSIDRSRPNPGAEALKLCETAVQVVSTPVSSPAKSCRDILSDWTPEAIERAHLSQVDSHCAITLLSRSPRPASTSSRYSLVAVAVCGR